ncbi:MAG: hypothetical protein ACHQPI_05140 [Thermoanaerobaculia bacterium]
MSNRGGRRIGGRVTRLLGLCLGLVLSATRATAASSFGPAASSWIRVGSVETVFLEIAAARVEERELVLSLDGGKTFPLRLTAEIGPGDRSASWRVPALPTEHAVLALREGGDGFEEEIVDLSAEFTILPGAGLPAEELRFRDGEWKSREADAGQPGLPSPSFGSAGPERWTRLDDTLAAFEEPVRALPVSSLAGSEQAGSDTVATPVAGWPAVPHASLFLPLRE